ncbi:MAG: HEAT repeat domain-containing protein, partial [Planctomycetes bacterium]|nr:HEAT repeat domain-containing protein [Planctomycetota bacterium]
ADAAEAPTPDAEAPTADAETPPADGQKDPTSAKSGKLKGQGVRDRLAKDRAYQRARRQALLTGRLATVLLVLAVLIGILYVARRPILRSVARAGEGELNAWALDILSRLEDPESFDLYVAHMSTRSDRFTPLVYRVVGRTSAPTAKGVIPPDDPDAVIVHTEVLISAIRGEKVEVQRGGLRAFSCLRERSWIRDPALLDCVAEALSSQDAITRRFAAIGLRNLSPIPAHHARLLTTVKSDPDRLARRFAIQALAKSEDPKIGAELATLKDDAPEVQRELFLAVARLGVPVPMSRLRALYTDFPTLRQTVIESLAARSDAGVEDLIELAIRDPSPGTRLAAAKALAKRQRRTGLDALLYALGDGDHAVRLEAIDSILARADGREAIPALVGALGDHQGWEELRRLHVALSSLTGHSVPNPVQSQELTWTRAISAWRTYKRQLRRQ